MSIFEKLYATFLLTLLLGGIIAASGDRDIVEATGAFICLGSLLGLFITAITYIWT